MNSKQRRVRRRKVARRNKRLNELVAGMPLVHDFRLEESFDVVFV